MHIGANGRRKRRVSHEALCQRPGGGDKLFLCYPVLEKKFKESKDPKFELGLSDYYEVCFFKVGGVHILLNGLLVRFMTFKYLDKLYMGFYLYPWLKPQIMRSKPSEINRFV